MLSIISLILFDYLRVTNYIHFDFYHTANPLGDDALESGDGSGSGDWDEHDFDCKVYFVCCKVFRGTVRRISLF